MSERYVGDACRLAVDIGGTFTDIVLEYDSIRTTTKVLTTHDAPEMGVMNGVERVLALADKNPADISLVLHGTTLATNALIERKGARTALLTTEGFRDVLEMGFEKRFAQYNLDARRPQALVPRTRRYAIPERISSTGKIIRALDHTAVRQIASQVREAGVEAVAVGFLHAYAYPQHERECADILIEELPGVSVSLSSEVCPEMREYERLSTTVANAYIRPLMAGYLNRLQTRLQAAGFTCPTFLMMSGGGLTTLDQATRIPIRLVESGPAGGAILAADIATSRGIDSVLAFDMGGTTAKICLIEEGKPDRSRRFEVAREYRDMKGSGLPLRIPVIEMVEIGAGGGSIARIDELQRIKVGPDSAGSDPGPVAYELGGTLPTVTDANLVLGKLDPDTFAGGSMTLNAQLSAHAIQRYIGDPLSLVGHWPAAGIVEIVEENMANAAQVHAVERGKEPSEYTMIAFGGGAPLHAARLAQKLGISTIIVPAGAGVGSAIGFLRAPISYQVVKSYRGTSKHVDIALLNELLTQMTDEAMSVVKRGAADQHLIQDRLVELRYLGQGHELSVELPSHELSGEDLHQIRQAFETLYQKIYGLTMPDAEIEFVSWSVTVGTKPVSSPLASTPTASTLLATKQMRSVYDAGCGKLIQHAVFERSQLQVGNSLQGPAVIVEEETTTIVPPEFTLIVDSGGALVLSSKVGLVEENSGADYEK
jgi:N-methylhydantoinase A